MEGAAPESLEQAVRASGLVPEGTGGVLLLSGGADSVGLAAGIVPVTDRERTVALHLNYGLREDSGEDEAVARELCGRLGIQLVVERPRLGAGNLQAEARDQRYLAAERLRADRGLDWIATGHTRTDLAETVLYRLATSPGRRALLGLPARRGAIVRPLLGLSRAAVRELVISAGLPFRDDPSNAEPRYARNRIRNEVLPILTELGPAAERVISETRAELEEESEALEALAAEALEAAGAGTGPTVPVEALEGLHPAIRRLAVRALAERVAGRSVPLGSARAREIWRLAEQPEGGTIELGEGMEARLEHGHLRIALTETSPPAEAVLPLPGRCRFGSWELRAELIGSPPAASGPEVAVLEPAALEEALTVRSWREGDRIRPLGLGGSKSLQDVFTDRKVPRSLRRTLPVLTSGGRIAWVAGVTVSEEFAARPGSERAVVVSSTLLG